MIHIKGWNPKLLINFFSVFTDMWQWLTTDVTAVAKEVLELCQNRPEKQVYMSLPRPGVSIIKFKQTFL